MFSRFAKLRAGRMSARVCVEKIAGGKILVVSELSAKGLCCMDHEAVTEAKEALLRFAEDWPKNVPLIIDIARVRSVGADFLGALVEVFRCCRRRGVVLRVCNPSPFAAEVFRITRLDQLFEIYARRQDAMAPSRRGLPSEA